MLFSSITFLFYFLPIVMLIYVLLPFRLRNGFLALASLFFYAWGEPRYVFIMLFSTVADYFFGYMIAKHHASHRKSLFFLIGSLSVNLSLLLFFKYSLLFLQTWNQIFSTNLPLPDIALPIGISFYTFQTMSYSIDVYRKKIAPQKNIIDFAAYVTLFPQLIAGPIVRYESVASELKERHSDFDSGVLFFIRGLAQKVLLANNMGLIWDEISKSGIYQASALTAWLGILAYAFQIYFDFCGYSNMAIGLGRMLGFHFPPNFDKPYISQSITEFWRRWHISLSSWFREYVYIPLGGNKKGLLVQIRNIAIVWLLTGLWHGASWNFLFWGFYFGILLIVEKLFLYHRLERLPRFFRHFYAIFFILIGWVFFAFDSIKAIAAYFSSMFQLAAWLDASFIYFLRNNAVLLVLATLFSTSLPEKLSSFIFTKHSLQPIHRVLRVCFYSSIFLLSAAYIVDSSYNPFLYFRF